MVNYRNPSLDTTFAALSDPTRRALLSRLVRGERTVTELARPFRMSLPAVSKHLRVLENAGLLTRKRDGRIHRCRLNARPMRDADDWIRRYQRFWEDRLDALADYLESTQTGGEDAPPGDKPSPSDRRSKRRRAGPSGRESNRRR